MAVNNNDFEKSDSQPAELNDQIVEYNNPNESLPFGIQPNDLNWEFAPKYYPSKFTIMKSKELRRFGGNCGGESISIEKTKNREINVNGEMLQERIGQFNSLVDHDGKVTLYSPLAPNKAGIECFIKDGELGNETGWDSEKRQRMFEYTLDLVSTGLDEYNQGRNAIITSITDGGGSVPSEGIQPEEERMF